jgi:hypothetical protein
MSKIYFSQDTEDAIIDYIRETDQSVRNRLYETRINRPFNKLVENLIHKYKFYHYDVSYEDTKHEVITFLIEKLNKFNPENGKAYSYFTIVGRNYLIAKNKGNYNSKKTKEEVTAIDENRDVINEIHNKEKQTELKSFFDVYIEHCDNNLNVIFIKKKDIQIANSILEIFKRRENIENFNKKALYILIREMTDASTHDITKIVNVLKKKYRELYELYHKNMNVLVK